LGKQTSPAADRFGKVWRYGKETGSLGSIRRKENGRTTVRKVFCLCDLAVSGRGVKEKTV